MSESNTRNVVIGIVVAAAGTVIGGLLIPPVGAFFGALWRLVGALAGGIWGVFTVAVPLWVVLLGIAGIALLALRRRNEAPPVAPAAAVRKQERPAGVGPPDQERLARLRLTDVEDGVLRRLARADGEWLPVEELGTARTSQLLLEQALDHLGELGLVEEGESEESPEVLYGLTALGRDFVIARGDVR